MNNNKLPTASVQSTFPNAQEPLSVLLQRQNRMQGNIHESSQKEYHQPRTSSSYAASSAVYRNNLLNSSLGASQVEREICEADSSQQAASTNNGILDHTRISATSVRGAWRNPNIFNYSAQDNPATALEAKPPGRTDQAGWSNEVVLSNNSASTMQSSRVLDSKQNNILLCVKPTSHFDAIVAEPTAYSLANMAGHSHWAKPDLIHVGIVDGFLPIYEVNHKITLFHPIRISDLNFSNKQSTFSFLSP